MKRKVGRPRKIFALNDNIEVVDPKILTAVPETGVVVPVKRGRGRPRKSPIEVSLEPREILVLTAEPGMKSVWGNDVKKGKRVNRLRKKDFASPEGLLMDSGSDPSVGASADQEEESSWMSQMMIPGPIPNLDDIFSDQSFLNSSDFFSDIG